MTTRSDSEHLFDEFPPISTEEWEDQIRRDLKGADYGETLLWHTRDDVTIRPYYRSEDLDQLPHVSAEAERVSVPSKWLLQQNVRIGAGAGVEDELQQALEGGAESIGLELHEDAPDVGVFLQLIPLDRVGIHLGADLNSPALFEKLCREAESRSLDREALRGSLGYDPLDHLARTGTLPSAHLDDAAALISEAPENDVRLLRAGVDTYHNAGATVVQETALAIATVSEYLASLIERGAPARDVLERMYISVSVSTTFLLEIAKMRALRLLIPQVVRAYLPEEAVFQLPIHAITSWRTMTLFDPHTNLLRATTEAASAVIGGCDVLVVRPFDAVSGGSAFSHRLARNIQHLLRHEANLDKVSDAAGGSYYVEAATDAVARRAWHLFKDIEARGGLIKAIQDGYVQASIRESREKLEADVAHQRRVLVGTNRYPNTNETTQERGAADWDRGASGSVLETPGAEAEPLEAFREAEAFEEIRQTTDRFEHEPSVLVLPIGSPAVRNARASFAANLLAAGGFEVVVPMGYATPEDALEGADSSPDLLVLAAEDAIYSSDVITQVQEAFSPSIIGIVAISNVELEVDFVINTHCDAVQTLRGIHELLRRRHEPERVTQS